MQDRLNKIEKELNEIAKELTGNLRDKIKTLDLKDNVFDNISKTRKLQEKLSMCKDMLTILNERETFLDSIKQTIVETVRDTVAETQTLKQYVTMPQLVKAYRPQIDKNDIIC